MPFCHRRAFLDGGAQNVAGGNGRDAQLIAEDLCLGPLAGRRGRPKGSVSSHIPFLLFQEPFVVTGGHIAFQRTAGLKRHTHDDQQRSTTQLDGGAGDVAEDDGEACHDGQEDRADQSDLGQGLRDEIAGGLARTDAGDGAVVLAELVGNVPRGCTGSQRRSS